MLPQVFLERMQGLLGSEYEEFLVSFDHEKYQALRLNPLKLRTESGRTDDSTVIEEKIQQTFRLHPVPWADNGYYYTKEDQPGKHPWHEAGLYYIQEPSAMAPVTLLSPQPGERILDLCAAPGGKSTQIASAMEGEGLLVTNEIHPARAKILSENVERMGIRNACVLNETLEHLADIFEEYFDRILVDAPCSGEGMFRKTPEARDEWSENNVKICAVRQAEILREAWKTLRPGGLLIYSTCTFNRLENEGSLEGLLAEAGEEIVESTAFDCPPEWGVVCGRVGPFRTFRFYPHRTRGEGFFAAVARKVPDGGSRVRVPKSRRTIFTPAGRRECAELARWIAEPGRMRFAAVADVYYAYYESQYEAVKMLAESLRVIASGVAMGQIFKERLKPDHALAMFCGLNRRAVPVAELSEEEALRFLRKQEAAAAAFEGMNLVTHGGAALGFAKRIQNRVNNMYPNSLRIFNL